MNSPTAYFSSQGARYRPPPGFVMLFADPRTPAGARALLRQREIRRRYDEDRRANVADYVRAMDGRVQGVRFS